MTEKDSMPPAAPAASAYLLDEQVGFILRQVSQRHGLIFAQGLSDEVTPPQWAAMAKLAELGQCSQNLLGRHTAMDVATIKGVVHRLETRGFASTAPDPNDRRRLVVSLTSAGLSAYEAWIANAHQVTAETLAPLNATEQQRLLDLLKRLR